MTLKRRATASGALSSRLWGNGNARLTRPRTICNAVTSDKPRHDGVVMAVKEFAENPSLFLKRNLVIQLANVGEGDTFAKDRTYFYVIPYENVWMKTQGGEFGDVPVRRFDRGSAKVYVMKCSKEKVEHGVAGYWLAYQQNQSHQVTIGTDAEYVFTPTVDGCTIGVGPSNGFGGHILSHINRGGWKANDQQVIEAKRISGENAVILDAGSYQKWEAWDLVPDNKIKTTVWGERTGNDWRFFYQSYRVTGGFQYTWLGVKSFPML